MQRLIAKWHEVIYKTEMAYNILRPRQDDCRLPDDIFKCIFFNENVLILIRISLKFVPKFRINHISALVQIMAWRRPGDKPLSGPVMVSLLTHICVTRPLWSLHVLHCKVGNIKNNYPQNWKSQLNLISYLISPGQNGHHFADNSFRRIFVNENVCISVRISLKFVPKRPIYNNPALD